MRYLTMIGVVLSLAVPPAIIQAQKPAMRRAKLEQIYRQRGEQIVRKQLKLTDGQMQKLRQVNSQFANRRRTLVRQRQGVQQALRDELARNGAADQQHVAQLNSQLDALRQQQFQLQQQERNEMSKFLTPVQQAQYQALQTRLREKAQALQGQPLSDEPGPAAP